MPFRINLGGEGEVGGALNQQGRWIVSLPGWRSSQSGETFEDLVRAGHDFLIADNMSLPLVGTDRAKQRSSSYSKGWRTLVPQWHCAVHQTMTTFFELFARDCSDPTIQDDPTWVDWQFPELVASSPFHLWRPGDPIAERGARYLIGVATWSGYDMRLLDVIAKTLHKYSADSHSIDVFKTAECQRAEDFALYIPGLREVSRTPVVGLWRDGQFYFSHQGHMAREWIAKIFDSTSSEIVAFVQDWIKGQALAP